MSTLLRGRGAFRISGRGSYTPAQMLLALTVGTALALAAMPALAERRVPVRMPIGHVLDDALVDRPGTERGQIFYWGGLDESTGLAVPGGVWDFELEPGQSDPLEGWTSEDLGDEGVFVRRVTAADFANDPASGLITEGGSTGSLWWGAHEDEANAGCWPGGMGYSNDWSQHAAKTFQYSGSGDVTISFDYFTDSVDEFDRATVHVVDDLGVVSPPLATYYGQIGFPTAPAHDAIVVGASHLPSGPGAFEVLFSFESDDLYSDGYSDSFGGFLNTVYGPLGLDDVHVLGEALDDLSDFETGADGWQLFQELPVGTFLDVRDLNELDPSPPEPECGSGVGCPLSNGVMIAADADGPGPSHPQGQWERLVSPPAYVGGTATPADTYVDYDTYFDLPLSSAVGYRTGVHYYPWICPTTLETSWTIRPLGTSGYVFGAPTCTSVSEQLVGVPASVESLKVVIELLADCERFGVPCDPPPVTNTTPYWDNIRLRREVTGDAPILAWDLLYQDIAPANGSLVPSATAEVHSHYDIHRADGDPTNALLGDSITVLAGNEPGTEVYLNFRVFPGPGTQLGNPWFASHGGDFTMPGGTWVKARMDTAEAGGSLVSGLYSSYDWPDGQTSLTKIIPDGVLSPGATVEYFFSASFTGTPEVVSVVPDTTDGVYLEFEILPGYFDAGGADVLAPCLLYVDAFNAGAQATIEEIGLANYLGEAIDVNGVAHDGWDRYDYLAAASNVPAPFARESMGNNGMTRFQSSFYTTILYNTGSYVTEGLRDGDAALLIDFLNGGFGDVKGLWLSGDGIGSILSRPGRPSSNALLADYAGAAEGSPGIGGRLDPSPGAAFGQPESYATVCLPGCPPSIPVSTLGTVGSGMGNLTWVDPATETESPYASISRGSASYGVVTDAFSLHRLRTTPPDFTGDVCPSDNQDAIVLRTGGVLQFLDANISPSFCPLQILDVDDGEPVGTPAVTRLFRSAPNPFNPVTAVRYELAAETHVTIGIFDVAGRRVRTLVDERREAGRYRATWDGLDDAGVARSSGVYWLRMRTRAGFESSTRLVLLK